MPMTRRAALGAAATAALVSATAAGAATDGLIAHYESFAAAQNARDLKRIGDHLLDDPGFLWVSDGMSVWGRDATLRRMASFQALEVWHVAPELERARLVGLAGGDAYLHLPLALTLGPAAAPETFRFLVSVLGTQTSSGWRIAALFTTTAKEHAT